MDCLFEFDTTISTAQESAVNVDVMLARQILSCTPRGICSVIVPATVSYDLQVFFFSLSLRANVNCLVIEHVFGTSSRYNRGFTIVAYICFKGLGGLH